MWRAAAQFKEVQTKLMDSVDAEEGSCFFCETPCGALYWPIVLSVSSCLWSDAKLDSKTNASLELLSLGEFEFPNKTQMKL